MKHVEPQPHQINWHRMGLVWLGTGVALCTATLIAQHTDYQRRLEAYRLAHRWTDANRWE
jgi:hypothetical protein